jgi:benzoyl-CoA-dihydrodiol lyase
VFATTAEGVRGQRAVDWGLADELAKPTGFAAAARALAERVMPAERPGAAAGGIDLPPLSPAASASGLDYEHVKVAFDMDAGTAAITVTGPAAAPSDMKELHAAGAAAWPLAAARELDDAISRLRFARPELGTWLLRTTGEVAAVLATDELLAGTDDWLAAEITGLWKRTLRRLEATSRSLIALIEPGSCFAGTLLEVALAADRQYMLDGVFEDGPSGQQPAVIQLGPMNAGALPAASGQTRLAVRFCGRQDQLEAAAAAGKPLEAADAAALGLVTAAPDDLDWEDEIRLVIAERAGFSPDALSGLEASLRFAGAESMGTKIFGRLSAWQNWIFLRPNASGPQGALRRYGTGQRADFDRKRV